jgi:hypothetical protein
VGRVTGVDGTGVLAFGVGVGVGVAFPSALLQARPFGVDEGVAGGLTVALGVVVLGFGVVDGCPGVAEGDGVGTGAPAWASYTTRK